MNPLIFVKERRDSPEHGGWMKRVCKGYEEALFIQAHEHDIFVAGAFRRVNGKFWLVKSNSREVRTWHDEKTIARFKDLDEAKKYLEVLARLERRWEDR